MTSPLDIENLKLDELMELNRRVVMRIRYLSSLKTRAHLDRFEVGDQVSFQSDGRAVRGMVIRVNQKSLSIRTEHGHWTIHPRLLTKIPASGSPGPKTVQDILNNNPPNQ